MDKMALGVIAGNRDFSPAVLAGACRDLMKLCGEMGPAASARFGPMTR